MDTLQLQDVFEPYYAGKEQVQNQRDSDGRQPARKEALSESPDASSRQSRLDALNRRFARMRPRPVSKGN